MPLPPAPPAAAAYVMGSAGRTDRQHEALRLVDLVDRLPQGELRDAVENVVRLAEQRRTLIQTTTSALGRRPAIAAEDAKAEVAALQNGTKMPTPKLERHDRELDLAARHASAAGPLVSSAMAQVDAVRAATGDLVAAHLDEVLVTRQRELEDIRRQADETEAELGRVEQLARWCRRRQLDQPSEWRAQDHRAWAPGSAPGEVAPAASA